MSLFEKFFIAMTVGTLLAMGITLSHAESRFSKVVDRTIASTVRIEVLGIDSAGIHEWSGAGVLIDSAGHILTCAHVVPNNSQAVYVRLYRSSGSVVLASIMRRDTARDLALIRLVNYSTPTPSIQLSDKPVVQGDEVVAIGMPYGLDWSVTTGVVSALNRDGLAINLLQTDAAINPGNSGGPLLNLDAELVGINESVATNANSIGFAVSIEEIRRFLSVFRGLDEAIR